MSRSGQSVFVYSFYLFLMGSGLTFAPNPVLNMLGWEPTQEPWIRILGLFCVAVSTYYFHAGRMEQREFYRASVFGRILFFLGMLLLVILLKMPPVLALVGAVDLIGALWTLAALHKDQMA